MKYGTLIFTKVVSGLYAQQIISQEKRDILLQTWAKAVKSQDTATITKLIKEIHQSTCNVVWQKELDQILEQLETIAN